MNLDLMDAIARLAAESFSHGSLPPDGALQGVKAVDVWVRGPHAAMLFIFDEEAELLGARDPGLHDVYLDKTRGAWRGSPGGTLTVDSLDEAVAEFSPGLHELSRTSCGDVRVTWAFATPEVRFIRLVAGREQRDRKPGREGFVLLGTTPDCPITYAHAIDSVGRQLTSEPILL